MKRFLILIALVAASAASYAQLSWNAKIGMNLSSFTGDVEQTNPKFGFHFGVGMEYQFTQLFSLQPSLMYTTKGVKAENADARVSLKYLELPVMAAFRLPVAENRNIVLKAGPYLAYALSGKLILDVYDGINLSANAFKHYNFEANGETWDYAGANRFELGLGLGIDYEFSLFFVGLNGGFGLTKFYGDGNEAVRNMNFSINVGFKF
ncbi:MAG: PorT family protein [Mediterranea sp.]|jgi:hypothetical protein|nr:PorT family protein [Mediterranea sp.]